MISLVALAALAIGMTALWVVSVVKRNVAIVDVLWGPAFIIVVVSCLLTRSSPPTPPQTMLAVLVGIWGLRLAIYLGRRNHGKPEDRRYVAMRKKRGPSFWWFSLLQVFGLQGVLAWVISLPLQGALLQATAAWYPLHALGLVLWATGLTFEALGDHQLSKFLANPDNAGKVMDRGLWRYTRHPNYFGDCTVWWGYYAVSLGCGAPWWTIVGPVVMTIFLLRVSGVTLLESTLRKRRPGYEAYVQRTSAFIPWPPKRAAHR